MGALCPNRHLPMNAASSLLRTGSQSPATELFNQWTEWAEAAENLILRGMILLVHLLKKR